MLKDKVILITGASRGIGAAAAKLAVGKYGAKIILHGKTDSENLRCCAREVDSPYVFCDVTVKDAVFSATEKAASFFGRIDGLLNCAGVAPHFSFLEINSVNFSEAFNVNVLGSIFFSQACIRHMIVQNSGRIVNVSSIRGIPDGASVSSPVYSMSKAAVVSLTKIIAKEFSKFNISANTIAPGFTFTDIAKLHWKESTWAAARSSLLSREANPNEIAEVALFLLSDRAVFINGETILADGGYLMAGK